jgi:hypothetical protein
MAGVKFMGLRIASLAAWVALLVAGLFAAWPFFNRGLVGTGEAYNYSLSVADAVTQMRAGVLPPLAGQSEYAFNARIHPLRNAPYLHYLCEGIDLVTFHRLAFWQLQNVSLVLSIFGALFACYGGLRWATDCPRLIAAFLACFYALSPPLMGAAHTFDLFMTVHAAVFVPLAIAACIKGCLRPSFSNDAWLAAALAAAWLTHPPVAFWLSVSVILVRLIAFAGNPRLWILANGLMAVILGLLLSGFVFMSAATLSPDLGYFSDEQAVWGHFPETILKGLHGAFPGMILPVSAGAGNLSDLQIGYVGLGLIGLSLFLAFRRLKGDEPGETMRLAAIGCASAALILVIMDLPVPFLTLWAWRRLPAGAFKLTTEWPMQRLYLVASAMSVFAAGTIVPRRWTALKAPGWIAPSAMLIALTWVVYQAKPFITRGIANRWTLSATQSAYRPSNLDLTITSYAFVGPPPTYVYGVVDPRFEFRILRNGVDEIASPLASGLAQAPVVQTGALRLSEGVPPAKSPVPPKLNLLPKHRYLLSFAFRIPPVQGLLFLRGPHLNRTYALPEAGQPKGFGMMDGERRAIAIWTDSDKPEEVEVRVWLNNSAPFAGKSTVFADYVLQDVNMEALPVRVQSLLPLRFTVDAPQGGCTVETPRRFLPGFEATVNGKTAKVLMSPYRQAMIPLPPGRSVVELSYPGPWQARTAFWISVSAWIGFFAWRAVRSPVPSRRWLLVSASSVYRYKWAVVTVIGVAALATLRFERHVRQDWVARAVGPVEVDFFLPYGRKNVNEPLLATGKVGAGVVVFVHYVDETHISLSADVWGSLYESRPIEVDYSKLQRLIVSDGALFPNENPRIKELSPTEADQLRSEICIELNGNVVIKHAADTFLSTPSEVLVGKTTFGSLTSPAFLGTIESSERLPIPRVLMLPASMHAEMDVRFPLGREGASEPLLYVSAGTDTCLLSVTYLSKGVATLSLLGKNGSILQAANVTFDAAAEHQITIRPATGETGILTLSCALDGNRVLGPENVTPSGRVPILRSGLNEGQIPGVEARFTGAELELKAVADSSWLAPGQTWGMESVIVNFPLNKVGRHEPILTSGITGAGDFIYVIYQDDSHVRLGFDHWNGVGFITDPIAVDYHAPHEIWISSRPLYPDVAGNAALPAFNAADRDRLRSRVRVAIDGKTVISSDTSAYSSSPSEVTVGTNQIGGSSADPSFSGIIYFAGRMDPLTVSW